MAEHLLRIKEVSKRVGLSRSELYRRLAVGEFPKPIRLGERARAWRETTIDEWIRQRETARGRSKQR